MKKKSETYISNKMAKKKKAPKFEVLGTQNFQDINGKSKHLKVLRTNQGKEKRHTGNEQYIDTQDGVVRHEVARMVRRTVHVSGIRKMM